MVTLPTTQGLHVIKLKETPMETGKVCELLDSHWFPLTKSIITFGDIPKAYVIWHVEVRPTAVKRDFPIRITRRYRKRWAWQNLPVIPEFGRLRQQNHQEFEARLG